MWEMYQKLIREAIPVLICHMVMVHRRIKRMGDELELMNDRT